jgi:hypothetical protein
MRILSARAIMQLEYVLVAMLDISLIKLPVDVSLSILSASHLTWPTVAALAASQAILLVEEAAELLSKIQTVNNLMLLTQDVSIAHLDSSQVLMESASRSILSARQQIQMEVVLLVTLDTRLQVIFVSLALKLTLM